MREYKWRDERVLVFRYSDILTQHKQMLDEIGILKGIYNHHHLSTFRIQIGCQDFREILWEIAIILYHCCYECMKYGHINFVCKHDNN